MAQTDKNTTVKSGLGKSGPLKSGPLKSGPLKSGLRRKRRIYLLLTTVAVFILAVALVLNALKDNIRLFYDPTEVSEKTIPPGQNFRLGGLVQQGSFKSTETAGILINKFTVTDGNKSIPVTFEGLLPDLFREGQGVVTEGRLNKNGLFIATEVLAKHDENYMPKEVIDSLKKRGEWKRVVSDKKTAATHKSDINSEINKGDAR